jgi:hypothetical protein
MEARAILDDVEEPGARAPRPQEKIISTRKKKGVYVFQGHSAGMNLQVPRTCNFEL